jgi:hypothetical protein
MRHVLLKKSSKGVFVRQESVTCDFCPETITIVSRKKIAKSIFNDMLQPDLCIRCKERDPSLASVRMNVITKQPKMFNRNKGR